VESTTVVVVLLIIMCMLVLVLRLLFFLTMVKAMTKQMGKHDSTLMLNIRLMWMIMMLLIFQPLTTAMMMTMVKQSRE
jgi:hypothetical protein